MKWDEEVDVVSTGSGIAGLARAVAVVDMGGEVFVADSRGDIEPTEASVAVRSRVDRLHWLEVGCSGSRRPTSTSRPCHPTSVR